MNALLSFSEPPSQLNNNGILIQTVSAPPNPHSTREIKIPPPPFPTRNFSVGGGDGEFSFCFFFSTIPNYSHRRIINKIVSPSMVQLTLPWSTRGIRSCHCQSLLMSFMEKALMVSLPLLFVFPPPFRFFLTASFFQLNFSSLATPAALPQSIKGSRARRCHTCP